MEKHGETPHWDTPYGTPKPGSGGLIKKLIILAVVGVVGLGIVGFVVAKKSDEKEKADAGKSDVDKLTEGEQPKADENESKQESSEHLRKLNGAASRLKTVIRKHNTALKQLKVFEDKNRDKVKTLAAEKPRNAKRLNTAIASYKKSKALVARIKKKKEGLVDELDRIETTITDVQQQLVVSGLFDESERKKIDELVAEIDARVGAAETTSLTDLAEKDLDDDKTTEPGPDVDEGELDAILKDG